MPKVLDRNSILFAISEQKLGFEFAEPERVDTDSLAVVLPILRHSVTPRIYTTFPETSKLHVQDSGLIDTMNAKNTGDLAVFVRSGTIFKGQTQERAAMRSTVVLPGVTVGIKVRCVHATRGISRGAKTEYGGGVPLAYEQEVYTSGFQPGDQHKYWGAVKNMTMCMMASTGKHTTAEGSLRERAQRSSWMRPAVFWDSYANVLRESRYQSLGGHMDIPQADDLSSHFEEFSKSFDKILSKVKLHQDQVGLALITDKGCETVEVFDAQDSWKALHDDAVKRLGPSLTGKDTASVFEYKPERAHEVVRGVLGLEFQENLIFEHKPSNGEPHFSVTGLTANGYTGEVVELDGKVIHLMLLKIATGQPA